MYLRTTRRARRDGSHVEYLQLAHNARNPDTGHATAEIIHNFGRADQLNRDELKRLCRSIARVCGLVVNDPLQIAAEAPLQSIGLPDGLSLVRTVELGPAAIIEALWDRLEIGKSLCPTRRTGDRLTALERALLAMTVNRLCSPESKLGVWDRWLKTVYLPSCQGLMLRQMYEAMDHLHENIEKVESQIFAATANLFNLDVDVIFYDTTTASFAIDEEDEDGEEGAGLRRFGHSKEGGWSAQVVVALAVTRDGIPVRSWVFPGNTADVTTVEKVKSDLKDWKLGRAMFVADAGMNSEDNKAALARACGKYLLACRMASVKEIKDEVLSRPGRYKEVAENLHVKEVRIGEGGVRERRYLVCFNPDEAKRQREHRETVITKLEEELSKHPRNKALAQWAIQLKASGRYGRYLKITKSGKIRIDRKAAREAARYDGKWVIETNDDTLTPEDAAKGYKALLVIERCFRSLKRTQIKMAPMYHWVPRRIETHVKICVLALLIERVIERECGRPWPRILCDLREVQATLFETDSHQFYQRNEVPSAARSIFKRLAVPLPKPILEITARAEATETA